MYNTKFLLRMRPEYPSLRSPAILGNLQVVSMQHDTVEENEYWISGKLDVLEKFRLQIRFQHSKVC